MSIRSALIPATALGAIFAGASPSPASAAVCPTTVNTINDPTFGGCNLVVTFNADGSISTSAPAGATSNYDGNDDALIGVVNNSGHSLPNLTISGTNIFALDGDGIDTFTAVANAAGTALFNPFFVGQGGLAGAQAYGGADAYYTGASISSGTVNFLTAIATGGSDYFSLEQPINLSAPPIITPTPEPSSLAALAAGLLAFGVAHRRRG